MKPGTLSPHLLLLAVDRPSQRPTQFPGAAFLASRDTPPPHVLCTTPPPGPTETSLYSRNTPSFSPHFILPCPSLPPFPEVTQEFLSPCSLEPSTYSVKPSCESLQADPQTWRQGGLGERESVQSGLGRCWHLSSVSWVSLQRFHYYFFFSGRKKIEIFFF